MFIPSQGQNFLPSHFLEVEKECPDFGKRYPDFVHLLVNFFIQNAVLRLSRRNNSEIFP